MPKQVDHDAYRKELAARAAPVFREHGYQGLGMRQIANELGVSKSALYHYFPSKEALFAACTDYVTSTSLESARVHDLPEEASPEDQAKAVRQLLEEMEGDFPGELSLLVDYLREMTPAHVRQDENMQLSRRKTLEMMEAIVGPDDALPVLCLLYGTMLQRYFDGGQTDLDAIIPWLQQALHR